jgi:uncharacterized protein YegL
MLRSKKKLQYANHNIFHTPEEIEELDQRIQNLSDNKKFVFIPFGVAGADMELLAKLAAQTSDQRLANKAVAYQMTSVEKFGDIFSFVSASIGAAIDICGSAKSQLDSSVAQAVTFSLD